MTLDTVAAGLRSVRTEYMRARSLAALVATVATLSVHAAPLRFAWPERATAKVSYSARRHRIGQSATKSGQKLARYDLLVRREGDGLVLERLRGAAERQRSPLDPEWQKVDGQGRVVPNYDEVQALLDDGAELVPALHLGRGGEFLGVAGTEPVRQELERILNRSGLPEPARARVRALFQDTALAAVAKEQWGLWAGSWRELDLEPGRAVVQHRRGVFPGTSYEIDLLLEVTHGGPVACPSDRSGRACVELRAVSRPDPTQVARTIERLNLSGPAGIKDLSLEQTLTLVTRPDTLQPQTCSRSLDVRLEHLPGGPQAVVSERLEETWTFEW